MLHLEYIVKEHVFVDLGRKKNLHLRPSDKTQLQIQLEKHQYVILPQECDKWRSTEKTNILFLSPFHRQVLLCLWDKDKSDVDHFAYLRQKKHLVLHFVKFKGSKSQLLLPFFLILIILAKRLILVLICATTKDP